jgi:hypothetical protein
VWRDARAVGEQFAGVLEYDHAVAEETPTLLRVAGDDPGSVVVTGIGGRTRGLVLTQHQVSDGMGVAGHYDQPGTVLRDVFTYECVTPR